MEIKLEARKAACKELARKVAPMYKVANWKWLGKAVTERMIYEKLMELLDELLEQEPLGKRGGGTTSIGSGGLSASRWKDEEGSIKFAISFRVQEDLDYWISTTWRKSE